MNVLNSLLLHEPVTEKVDILLKIRDPHFSSKTLWAAMPAKSYTIMSSHLCRQLHPEKPLISEVEVSTARYICSVKSDIFQGIGAPAGLEIIHDFSI